MSPEQARGLVVDKRTRYLGIRLSSMYEMLTGRDAFGGLTPSDTLAAILERDADLQALPAVAPAGIERLLKRCFEKDPRRRLRDIGEARIEIEDAMRVLAARTDDVVPVPAKSTAATESSLWPISNRRRDAGDVRIDIERALADPAAKNAAAGAARTSRVAWLVAAVATSAVVGLSMPTIRYLLGYPATFPTRNARGNQSSSAVRAARVCTVAQRPTDRLCCISRRTAAALAAGTEKGWMLRQ